MKRFSVSPVVDEGGLDGAQPRGDYLEARTGEGAYVLHVGDARKVLASFPEASVHLVLTSPPYWTLKQYEDVPGQLGHIADYKAGQTGQPRRAPGRTGERGTPKPGCPVFASGTGLAIFAKLLFRE